ncbi:hypothetical protein VDGE_30576 [Verticillium dahliae]|uniref:Uncharacterized protein n=1 Tax=Verticillium dahliae TaxID=27337 RepID=A0A444RZG8_VERDA|nr:hypothetical protein VDGE_30576 [Verticillium dahliae]
MELCKVLPTLPPGWEGCSFTTDISRNRSDGVPSLGTPSLSCIRALPAVPNMWMEYEAASCVVCNTNTSGRKEKLISIGEVALVALENGCFKVNKESRPPRP